MLPRLYPLLTAAPPVTALVADRIFRHGDAPQEVTRPYVTWFLVAGTPENQLSDVPSIDRNAVQVDCWHPSDDGVEQLAAAVRDALEARAHMTGVVINGRDPDTRLYRLGMQFDFFTGRSA